MTYVRYNPCDAQRIVCCALSHDFLRAVTAVSDVDLPFLFAQVDFLVERLGGPKLYTQRKGKMRLIHRHSPYDLNSKSAARWLEVQPVKYVVTEGSNEEFDRQKNATILSAGLRATLAPRVPSSKTETPS